MSLAARAAAALGREVTGARALHGGDLSTVTALVLEDGSRLVAKEGTLVETEARMLQAMAGTGAPVPGVVHVELGLLLIEYLEETAATPAAWDRLGRVLRAMHDHTAPEPGWPEPYAFGRVAIDNAPAPDWPTFWAERRLLSEASSLPPDLARRLETLAARLPDILPKHPPLSLLHGDLWSGNLLFGPGGAAHLIDPACYNGHAEVDLAMLSLFDRPGPGFEAAYGARDPGWETRRNVYSLWPSIVHLRLFGTAYRGMTEGFLAALGH